MITAKNLSVSMGSAELLKNVSVTLPSGKLSIAVGRNGAGKSTFLKAICGDIPSEGNVYYDGTLAKDLHLSTIATQRAVVSQHARLSFDFTVEEVVLMGRTPHINGFGSTKDYQIVHYCMQKVGMSDFKERSFPTLSGGEKQRVRCAAALAQICDHINAQKPTYLLLDEPTSSLDLAHQHQLLNLLREIADQGVTVFAIIHDLNIAAQYADRIMLLKDGTLLASGAPREVFQATLLERVFDCPIEVITHPYYQCPLVLATQKQNETIN